ncbi:MAG: hypothetical protein ACPIOQ_57775, partial [Promethearchaeia archaeon]
MAGSGQRPAASTAALPPLAGDAWQAQSSASITVCTSERVLMLVCQADTIASSFYSSFVGPQPARRHPLAIDSRVICFGVHKVCEPRARHTMRRLSREGEPARKQGGMHGGAT